MGKVEKVLKNNMRLFEIKKDEISDKIIWFSVYNEYYRVDFSEGIKKLKKIVLEAMKETDKINYHTKEGYRIGFTKRIEKLFKEE